MIKKRVSLSLLGIVLVIFACMFIWNASQNQPQTGYFLSVPSVRFSNSQIPMINIEIEGRTLPAKLDLGFVGQISTTSQILNQISNKTLIGTNQICGWNGKRYESKVYKIPKIELGDIACYEFHLQESPAEFERDAVLNKDEFSQAEGIVRLGWNYFYGSNLFLDLKNHRVEICDSIKTWEDRGNSLDKFIKVPLHINPITHNIEIVGLIDHQPYRCTLDTGITVNFLHKVDSKNLTIEETIWNPEYISELTLQIGGKDFGQALFHHIPLTLSREITAILGMEFFLEHKVYFDFPNKKIYISLEE